MTTVGHRLFPLSPPREERRPLARRSNAVPNGAELTVDLETPLREFLKLRDPRPRQPRLIHLQSRRVGFLRRGARRGRSEIMGPRHRYVPVDSIRPRRESIIAGPGGALLKNFLALPPPRVA